VVLRYHRRERLILRVGREHLHVLLVRAAQVNVHELADIETETVRAIRGSTDNLRVWTSAHRLAKDNAEVVIRQAARGWLRVALV